MVCFRTPQWVSIAGWQYIYRQARPSFAESHESPVSESFVSFSLFIAPPPSPPPPPEVFESSEYQNSGCSLVNCRKERNTMAAEALSRRLALSGARDDGAAAAERTSLLADADIDGGLDRNGAGIAITGEGPVGIDHAGTANVNAEERVVGGGAGTFTRNLGAVEAFAIVVSIVIGSGVFTSPGSIDTNVPSPGVALLVWLVGGVLAWTGASTMAELGTAIPGEGIAEVWTRRVRRLLTML